MSSLEFGNLPLIEATVNVFFANPIDLGWDIFAKLERACRPLGMQMTGLFAGQGSFFALGIEPGASCESEAGIQVRLARDRLSATWKYSGSSSQYVRYPDLRQALQTAHEGIGSPAIGITNMSYVNRAPSEHGTPTELLTSQAWPPLSQGRLKDYNVAWLLDDGFEFRLQVAFAEGVSLITTAAGIVAQNQDLSDLDPIHETLQREFLALLTDKAKVIWELK